MSSELIEEMGNSESQIPLYKYCSGEDAIEFGIISFDRKRINSYSQNGMYYQDFINHEILNYLVQIFVAYTLYIERGIVFNNSIRKRLLQEMSVLDKCIFANKYTSKTILELTVSYNGKKNRYSLYLIDVDKMNKAFGKIHDIYLVYFQIIERYELPLVETKISYSFHSNPDYQEA
jgi:hypothetical protein